MKKIVLDRGHDRKRPGVANDGDKRFAGMDANGEVHEAVKYFNRSRGVKV